MRRLAVNALTLAVVLAAATALAMEKGGTLYAKCNPTKVQKKPSASAATEKSLKPGDEVAWQGASKSKPYHEVQVGGATGYVDQACLTRAKPTAEYASSGGAAISAEAFKSSAAATKGLSSGAITYANEKGPDKQRLAAQIIYVEENTKNRTAPGDKEFAAWAKKAGVKFAAKGAK
jgi:hypothetical protein